MSPEKTSRRLPPSRDPQVHGRRAQDVPCVEELEREMLPQMGDPPVGNSDHQVLHREGIRQGVERLALRPRLALPARATRSPSPGSAPRRAASPRRGRGWPAWRGSARGSPARTSSGSRPAWSMWAWLRTMPSTRRGSNGSSGVQGRASRRGGPGRGPRPSESERPAASSRCIEPVTWPAAPQKVSRTLTSLLRVPKRRSPASPRPGQDVAELVELAVERGGEDGDVGVRLEHSRHPFRGRHEAEEADPAGAGLAERASRLPPPSRRWRASDRARRSHAPPRRPGS